MGSPTSPQSERTLEFIETYLGARPCECGRQLDHEPTEDCESFEHEAVWQACRAEHWRDIAWRLNPSHHMYRENLEEPNG